MEKKQITGYDDLHDRHIIGYEVHALDKMLKRIICSRTQKKGPPAMQNWIISFLYDHPTENIFQRDIEARFHIPRSTATGILQGMQKDGFLTREAVPNDARLKRLVLTEKAIAHKLRFMNNMNRIEQMLKKDIPADKLDTFFEVIRLIEQNIENNTINRKEFFYAENTTGPGKRI